MSIDLLASIQENFAIYLSNFTGAGHAAPRCLLIYKLVNRKVLRSGNLQPVIITQILAVLFHYVSRLRSI